MVRLRANYGEPMAANTTAPELNDEELAEKTRQAIPTIIAHHSAELSMLRALFLTALKEVERVARDQNESSEFLGLLLDKMEVNVPGVRENRETDAFILSEQSNSLFKDDGPFIYHIKGMDLRFPGTHYKNRKVVFMLQCEAAISELRRALRFAVRSEEEAMRFERARADIFRQHRQSFTHTPAAELTKQFGFGQHVVVYSGDEEYIPAKITRVGRGTKLVVEYLAPKGTKRTEETVDVARLQRVH